MHCAHVHIPGLGDAIVCTSGRRGPKHCCQCDQVAQYACDWKLGAGKTCDRQLCPVHAEQVAENKHLCPKHADAYQQWLTRKVQRGASVAAEPSGPQGTLFR